MWRVAVLVGCAIVPWGTSAAQPGARSTVAPAVVDTLTFARFVAQVEANHPVAQQARLVASQARLAV
ncbi:MAG: hypothetical protein WCK74_14350, partial [Gemmatimonadaceae bacterium]